MAYEHVIKNVSTGETTIVPFTEAEIAAANAANKKAELAALLDQYKAGVQMLQLSWLTATVMEGETEESKKAVITQDLADLKAQYLLDVSAVKAKYL